MSMSMPGLLTDDERKKREKSQHLALVNVMTAMLALLQSLPAYTSTRYNIDMPWVAKARSFLMDLLACPLPNLRRAAAEAVAQLGLKVGDGVALPGHDLGDHAVTSTFTEGPMVVLM